MRHIGRKWIAWMLGLLLLAVPGVHGAQALTVYYSREDKLFREGIKHYQDSELEAKAFATPAALHDAWTAAYLSGEAPDVLLMDYRNTLPIWRLVQEGAFYDLSDLLREDVYLNPNDYLQPLLSAGSFDGGQYFMPMAFALTHAFTTQERLDYYEIDLNPYETALSDCVDMLWRHMEEVAGMEDVAALAWRMRREDGPMQMMELAGLPIVDYMQGAMIADKNSLFEISTMIRTMFEHSEQLRRISLRYGNNFIGAAERISFMMEDEPFANNLRYFDTAYGAGLWEEMVCYVLPDWDSPGTYHAEITQFGAVSKGAADPEAGYALLRYLQDYDVSNGVYNKYVYPDLLDLPLSRAVLDKHLEILTQEQGNYIMLGGSRTAIEPLPEAYLETLWATFDAIEDGVIPDRAVGQILLECLEPYYLMEADFEDCYDELEARLTLYLTEPTFSEAR